MIKAKGDLGPLFFYSSFETTPNDAPPAIRPASMTVILASLQMVVGKSSSKRLHHRTSLLTVRPGSPFYKPARKPSLWTYDPKRHDFLIDSGNQTRSV